LTIGRATSPTLETFLALGVLLLLAIEFLPSLLEVVVRLLRH
jgi:hypothetical protein